MPRFSTLLKLRETQSITPTQTKQNAPGKTRINSEDIKTKLKQTQIDNINSIILSIIKEEKDKYISADTKTMLNSVFESFKANITLDLKEHLYSHYTDKTNEKYLAIFLVLLGIGLECPVANGNRNNEIFNFLINYYQAIINVYKTQSGPKNAETLYDFIMSYFARVCNI
jgi:hypothetical protein